jgi:hypothetical protein
MNLKQIYNLKDDSKRIRMVQEVSLDKNSYAGYKTENELLFGTEEWFNEVENGIIPKQIIKGFISRVYMSGHNDYPEFEIENDEGKKTTWQREGTDDAYKVGKRVELIYVEQKYKHPIGIVGAISKCVIKIKIAE